jgi:hypothetical protein
VDRVSLTLSREILLLIFLKGVGKLSFLLLIFEYRKRLIPLEKGGRIIAGGFDEKKIGRRSASLGLCC